MLSELQFWILDVIDWDKGFQGIYEGVISIERLATIPIQRVIKDTIRLFDYDYISCFDNGQRVPRRSIKPREVAKLCPPNSRELLLEDGRIPSLVELDYTFVRSPKGREEHSKLKYEKYFGSSESDCCEKAEKPIGFVAVDLYRDPGHYLYQCQDCGAFWEAEFERGSHVLKPGFERRSTRYVQNYYPGLEFFYESQQFREAGLDSTRNAYHPTIIEFAERDIGFDYIRLLHPTGRHFDRVFTLADQLKSEPGVITEFISCEDWRGAIVGAALAMILNDKRYSYSLVERLQGGSFATPQLGVALALINNPLVVMGIEKVLQYDNIEGINPSVARTPLEAIVRCDRNDPKQVLSAYYALKHMDCEEAAKAAQMFEKSGKLQMILSRDIDNVPAVFYENYNYWKHALNK